MSTTVVVLQAEETVGPKMKRSRCVEWRICFVQTTGSSLNHTGSLVGIGKVKPRSMSGVIVNIHQKDSE